MRDKYSIRHFYARQNTGLLDSKRNYIKMNLSRRHSSYDTRHPRNSLLQLGKIYSQKRGNNCHSSNER